MKGNWFKWFSPDDVMYLQTIENLVDVAKNFENTIVYSNWNIINESGKLLRSFSETNYNKLNAFDFNVRLLEGQQININTTLIPSTLAKKIRFRSLDDPVLIDYDFFLQAALYHQTKFYLIEKPLIKYRIHKSQLSHQNIVKSVKNLKNFIDNELTYLSEEKKKTAINKIKNRYYFNTPVIDVWFPDSKNIVAKLIDCEIE